MFKPGYPIERVIIMPDGMMIVRGVRMATGRDHAASGFVSSTSITQPPPLRYETFDPKQGTYFEKSPGATKMTLEIDLVYNEKIGDKVLQEQLLALKSQLDSGFYAGALDIIHSLEASIRLQLSK